MTEKEFQDSIRIWGLQIENSDIQKLVDRYINSVGFTIDTKVIIEHMYEETNRQKSLNLNAMNKTTNSTIISKIAKKLIQK